MSQSDQEKTNISDMMEQIMIKPSQEVRSEMTNTAAGCTGKCISGSCRTIG